MNLKNAGLIPKILQNARFGLSLGFSLAEILISLFLASLLMTILSQVYWVTKKDYMAIQKRLDRHFDVLWVSELLANSIRRSGFTPCLGIEHLKMPEATPTLSYSNATQSITTHRMEDHFVPIKKLLSPGKILVSTTTNLNEKRPLLIADCYHAEIHAIRQIDSSSSGKIITLDKPLAFNYLSTSYAGEWIEETWFVKNNTEGKPSLYYHYIQTEELTPLIQALQITKHAVHSKSLFEVTLQAVNEKTNTLFIAALNS